MLLISVPTMEALMVQKADKGNTESKKPSTTPSDATTKNQPQHLNKHSNKSSKNTKRNDPSGLPKYR